VDLFQRNTMGGKNKGGKNKGTPSDDELIEAAIMQAHAERGRLQVSKPVASHSGPKRVSTRQTRTRATERLINAVEAGSAGRDPSAA
jgi:hypothetical protein